MAAVASPRRGRVSALLRLVDAAIVGAPGSWTAVLGWTSATL